MKRATQTGFAALCTTSLALAQPSEVVVQAGPLARRGLSRDDSVAGTVIQGTPLRSPGAGAADVLRGLPGLTVIDTGGFGALSTASIRGATSAQTPVYLAGIRLNDDVGGTADLSTVPLSLVDRVEIYRGHAPLQADRLAIGGALFFDPRRPSRPGASASLSTGSFGFQSARVSASAGTPSSWGLLGSLGFQRATNDYAYQDDRGTRFDTSDDRTIQRRNADTSTRDLWLIGDIRLSQAARLTALSHGVRREQGIPGLGLLPTRAARASLDRFLGAIRGEYQCPEAHCDLTITTSALLSDTTFHDPLRELALDGISFRSRGSRVEQSAFLRGFLHERFSLQGAVDLAVERLIQSTDELSPAASSRRFSRWALGGVWNFHDHGDFIALVALECNGPDGGSDLCNLPVEAGRFGLRWRIEELELLAHAGRYGRAPTLGEQHGVSATVRGNPALRPEQGQILDGGLRHHGRVWGIPTAFEIFAFLQQIADRIVYQRSSLGYLRPYNVGMTRTVGLEIAAQTRPWPWLTMGLALTALDPRDTSPNRLGANDILPFRSRLQAAPSMAVKPGGRKPWGLDETILEVRYVHQSSRYGDTSGQVLLPAQGSLDLELTSLWWRRRLGVRLRGTNVLDQPRRDVVGFPLPGRAIFASVELTWT
ncbi:MAG: TonB-dependent receptor [Myxococcales bacterium]|nr:TonB-dependent receptor [Polyangiaceae bacterium]MDW8250594.1 TonB-dependent receptor [Myxococcales bacterium]